MCPTLCRLPAYWVPGLPSPTTSQGPSLTNAPQRGYADARHRTKTVPGVEGRTQASVPVVGLCLRSVAGECRFATLTCHYAPAQASAAAADAADWAAAISAAAA